MLAASTKGLALMSLLVVAASGCAPQPSASAAVDPQPSASAATAAPLPTETRPSPPPQAPPSEITPPSPTATPCVPPASRPSTPPVVAGSTPYREGLIVIKLAACRDVNEVLARYGLPRPAYHLPSPTDPSAIAIGLDRYYHVTIALGTERAEVQRLARHSTDFDHVAVVSEPRLCVVQCPPDPFVRPTAGPRGTSFQLQFCCWRGGTPVEKIFTTPDGRTIRLEDTSRDDGTVAAGWGSGPNDALGTYEVKVRANGIAQVLSFRIE